MLQQQETLYFVYTNLGPHVHFQTIKSTRADKGVRVKYRSCTNFFRGWTATGSQPIIYIVHEQPSSPYRPNFAFYQRSRA